MVGWHHQLKEHDFEQAPGDGKRTAQPDVLQHMGSQRVRHDQVAGQQPTQVNVSLLGSAFHFRLDLLCWASLLRDILQTSCSIMFFFCDNHTFFYMLHLRFFWCDDSFQIKMPFYVALWILSTTSWKWIGINLPYSKVYSVLNDMVTRVLDRGAEFL